MGEPQFKAYLDADTFRRAALVQSNEETRYYLNGVLVEAHPDGGAQLVATNGHMLVVLRDPSGVVENGPAIVRLSQSFLRECGKRDRRKPQPRKIIVSGQTARLERYAEGGFDFGAGPSLVTLAYQWAGTLIDGTFPDYRRVVPQITDSADKAPRSFDAAKLAVLSQALRTADGMGGVRLVPTGEFQAPMIVLPLHHSVNGFGVLMSVRGDDVTTLPAWFRAPVEAPQKQAA